MIKNNHFKEEAVIRVDTVPLHQQQMRASSTELFQKNKEVAEICKDIYRNTIKSNNTIQIVSARLQ